MKPSDRVVSLSSFYSSGYYWCRQIQYLHQWYLHEIHRNLIHITRYECSIVTGHRVFRWLNAKDIYPITHVGFPQKSQTKKKVPWLFTEIIFFQIFQILWESWLALELRLTYIIKPSVCLLQITGLMINYGISNTILLEIAEIATLHVLDKTYLIIILMALKDRISTVWYKTVVIPVHKQ